MTVLPIAARELRVTARRPSTHWSRCAAAALAIGVSGWFLSTVNVSGGRRVQVGAEVFEGISWCSFLFALLIGVRATADCISEEKREGTLGLLFLTDLKGYDIVFGKLFSTSLTAFYSLLALIPILAIPVMLGGVSGELLWRTALVLINTMFFSLAVGLCVSAIGRHERKAMVTTFVLILLFTGGFPLLGAWLEDALPGFKPSDAPAFFDLVSPGYAMGRRDGPAVEFWLATGTVHLLAWMFLFVACRRLPYAWQDKASSSPRRPFTENLENWMRGGAVYRAMARRRMLEINPVFWLTARDRRDLIYVWAFLLAGVVIWGVGLWRSPRSWFDEGAYFFTAIVAHSVIKLWMATQACRRFGEDRRSGALELMLSTPLSVDEILRGQLLALRHQFQRPVMLILLVDVLFIIGCIHREYTINYWRNAADPNWTTTFTFLAGMLMLVVDAYAIVWAGMWTGLTSRHANRAAIAVFARVVALPWLAYFLVLPVMGTALFINSAKYSFAWFLGVWLAINLSNSFVWFQWARTKLRSQFRDIATQRMDASGSGGLKRWFSAKAPDSTPKPQG